MTRRLSQKVIQGQQHGADDEVVNRAEKVNDGYVLRGAFAERYTHGYYYFEMHLLVRILGADAGDATRWCVGCYWPPEALNRAGANGYVVALGDIPPDPGEVSNRHVQEAMLAEAVQVVEKPQRMGAEGIASVVRLQTLDNCLRLWMQAANLGAPVVPEQVGSHVRPPLPIFIPEDWELGYLGDIRGKRSGVGSGEGVGEQIKARPQIAQTISNEHRERVWRWLIGSDKSGERPGLRINLLPDAVVFATHPGALLAAQIIQVQVRPLDLQFMIERHALSLEGDGEQTHEADPEDGDRS
jgi:hypothetical protein